MRPGQNKRMRGRPSNNRRGPNPLTRSYESNGPDVKIRGNAHHVAEKYLQLARDAHTNGDPVAAENYLQHAEHYFRLIASAQAAQLQQQNGASRPAGDSEGEDLDDEDDSGGLSDRFASPAERGPAPYQAQPGFRRAGGPGATAVAAVPGPRALRQRSPAARRSRLSGTAGPLAQHRPQDRGPRDNRPYQDRQEPSRDNRDSRDNRFPRDNRPRDFRPYREANPPRETAVPSEPGLAGALPSFITAPARGGAAPDGEDAQFSNRANYADGAQPTETEAASGGGAPIENMEAAPRYPSRGRRRRIRPNFSFDGPQDAQGSGAPEQPAHPDEAPAGE